MKDEYKKDLSWSGSNKKRINALSKSLQKNRRTDHIINDLHHYVFEKIDCLSCGNCCRTTGPMLLNKDIERLSRHLKVRENAFVETYLREDEDGDFVFKSMPCPFLQEDNYCSVYEHRPKACRAYPHTDQKGQLGIMHITRKNSRVCPAVSQIFQVLVELDS
ncbi:MAG: YkgJ family cysteine cluster protein [Flavobacteriales bacterium]|nr:YkgJ family cysteine cluster protein [Flavobacteriales bacterium]